jgi:diaminopimelate epimerase
MRARISDNGRVSVNMGVPDFNPGALPFLADAEADRYPLEADGRRVEIGAVSMGNPHAVVMVDSVDAAPVATLGPSIERHPRSPRRVNVGFLEIISRTAVRLRAYERGADETLACGTSACAAVAVVRRRKLLDAEVRIIVPGGQLQVSWDGLGGSPIWLSGPAAIAYTGYFA